jgi:phosphoribosylanthranilate isomerase
MKTKRIVKICGLKTQTDIALCADCGADILGFVVDYPRPVPWNLRADEAAALIAKVPASCQTCIVTGGSPEKIIALAQRLRPGFVQLHYTETLAETAEIAGALKPLGIHTIKPLFPNTPDLEQTVATLTQTDIWGILVDPRTPQNAVQGADADVSLYRRVRELTSKPVILAGGITEKNVTSLLEKTQAQYLDIMTGVERAPGVKDARKLTALLRAVRQHERDTLGNGRQCD